MNLGFAVFGVNIFQNVYHTCQIISSMYGKTGEWLLMFGCMARRGRVGFAWAEHAHHCDVLHGELWIGGVQEAVGFGHVPRHLLRTAVHADELDPPPLLVAEHVPHDPSENPGVVVLGEVGVRGECWCQ